MYFNFKKLYKHKKFLIYSSFLPASNLKTLQDTYHAINYINIVLLEVLLSYMGQLAYFDLSTLGRNCAIFGCRLRWSNPLASACEVKWNYPRATTIYVINDRFNFAASTRLHPRSSYQCLARWRNKKSASRQTPAKSKIQHQCIGVLVPRGQYPRFVSIIIPLNIPSMVLYLLLVAVKSNGYYNKTRHYIKLRGSGNFLYL